MAQALGFGAVGIEKDKVYCELIANRLKEDKSKAGERVSLNGNRPIQLGFL